MGTSRPGNFQKRSLRLKKEHREAHGEWCPGAPELEHEAHHIRKDEHLTVDHIVKVRDGGSHAEENLRILCNTVNNGRDRIEQRLKSETVG